MHHHAPFFWAEIISINFTSILTTSIFVPRRLLRYPCRRTCGRRPGSVATARVACPWHEFHPDGALRPDPSEIRLVRFSGPYFNIFYVPIAKGLVCDFLLSAYLLIFSNHSTLINAPVTWCTLSVTLIVASVPRFTPSLKILKTFGEGHSCIITRFNVLIGAGFPTYPSNVRNVPHSIAYSKNPNAMSRVQRILSSSTIKAARRRALFAS